MKPRHKVYRAIELIKRFEGYRRSAAQLPDGRWTIGYGHTKTARAGAEVSESDAEALLVYDLMQIGLAVNDWTFTPLTQNQFDALVSFAFSVGLENFRGSAVLRRVNEGALLQAAAALEAWRKADFQGERIVVDALVRRRAAEKALFLTPTEGWVATPSAVVQPVIDYDAVAAQSRERPVSLIVPLEGDQASVLRDPVEEPVSADDEANSPAAAAAATLTARLESLVPTEERSAAAVAAGAEPAAATPRPTPEPDPDVPPTPRPIPSRPLHGLATVTAPEPRSGPFGLKLAPLAVLGILGLISFGFAIFWGFNSRPASGGSTVAWLAGAAGVACMVIALYRLLQTLGGTED